MNDQTRFQRAAALFLTARAKGLSEREDLLSQACAGDAALRASVEALLAGAERPLPFGDLAAELGGALMPLATDVTPRADSRIGPYRLLEKLGEGGFGTVFMAEQVEPVRRRVALKLVRPELDSRQVIARFEAERQALAMMDHPNITRVLDAGTTDGGRPYFVMELIRGLPITQFCDQNRLSPRERLELMLPVCHAVQHAHQKGIIHRDLKPSNVLVTVQDGVPVPKVIDFGIAKALHAPLTQRTLFTEFRQVMGTPEYMSPEQAETSAMDVDTRADVYSLGVMLYELLTGTTPLDVEMLRRADYGEMQRLIREVEPPTPSRRLDTLGAKGRRTPAAAATRVFEIARARASEPSALRREVSGDLDWIAMRCLEKDRNRRYESAGELASDIERYLDDEPVAAGPPSALYRLVKLARRHRALFVATAIVLVGVAVALAGVSWGLVRALAERDVAMTARAAAMQRAREAHALSDVMRDMLRVAGPRGLRDDRYTVRQMLTDFEAGLGQRLADHPENEVAMRLVLGEVLEMAGRRADFVAQLEQAAERARRSLPPTNPVLPMAIEYLAYAYSKSGRPRETERLAEEALALRRQVGGDAHLGWTMLALARSQLGRHAAALAAADEAERQALAAQGEASEAYGSVISVRASLLVSAGRIAEAEPLLSRAIDLRRATLGPAHSAVVMAGAQHARVRLQLGDVDGAEAEVAMLAASPQTDQHTNYFWSAKAAVAQARAACAAERGHFDEAVALRRDLLAEFDDAGQAADPASASIRLELAELLLHLDDPDGARALLRTLEPSPDDDHADEVATRVRILSAVCDARSGPTGAAIAAMEDALAGLRRTADPDAPCIANAAEWCAETLLDAGHDARAAEMTRLALAIRTQHPYPAWRLLATRALSALARRRQQPAPATEFAATWQALRDVAALPPALRRRLAAAAEPVGAPAAAAR